MRSQSVRWPVMLAATALMLALTAPVVAQSPAPSPAAQPAETPGEPMVPMRTPEGTMITVVGTQRCVEENRGTVLDGRVNGMVYTCEDVTDDPRTSGTVTMVLNVQEHDDGRADIWGTARLVNAEGEWKGNVVGVRSPRCMRAFFSVLTGHGAFEGLEYHQNASGYGYPLDILGTIDETTF